MLFLSWYIKHNAAGTASEAMPHMGINIMTLIWSDKFRVTVAVLSWNWHMTSPLMNGVINSLSPRRNRRHFSSRHFQMHFLNENAWISIEISLKFVHRDAINNIPALVPIMAWRRLGDKPLSEPMMVSLPTHICVTRPQWVNALLQVLSINHRILLLLSQEMWEPAIQIHYIQGLLLTNLNPSMNK